MASYSKFSAGNDKFHLNFQHGSVGIGELTAALGLIGCGAVILYDHVPPVKRFVDSNAAKLRDAFNNRFGGGFANAV